MPDGYGYTDPKTSQRVSALRDMFDGGGAGRSGDQFKGGGAISALGNALKVRPLGSTAPREQIGFRGRMGSREYFRDMFDGGGAGASSSAGFADGPYGGLANNLMALGLLRPLGATRGAQAAPRLRPNIGMPLSTMGAYGNDVTVGGSGAPYIASTGGTAVQPPSPIAETILPILNGPRFADRFVGRDAAYQPLDPIALKISSNDARIAEIDRLMADLALGDFAPPYADPTSQPMRLGTSTGTPAHTDPTSQPMRLGTSTNGAVTPPMNTEMYDRSARRFGNLSRTFRPETIMAQQRKMYGYGF